MNRSDIDSAGSVTTPSRWGHLALCFALLGGGCNVSESGNPPLEPSDPQAPVVLPELLSGAYGAAQETWTLSGAPGAVAGSAGGDVRGAMLHVYPLQNSAPSITAVVADDGSFSLELPAAAGTQARIQSTSDEGRGAPLDIEFSEGLINPLQRPLADCFVLDDDDADLVLAGLITEQTTVRIPLHNRCSQTVEVTAPYARSSIENGPRVEPFIQEWNTILEGVSVNLKIRVTPGPEAGTFDDVIIIPMVEPEGIFPVSVRADVDGY